MYRLTSPYQPMGDQPEAIRQLVAGLHAGAEAQTLLGVTGSGKTFTVANVIAEVNRPTLILSHNKTLAAQLYSEMRQFFPNNAVEYFVSYYDYYQPEAYIPSTDTYIEKDLSINEEIDRLRLSAIAALLSGRKDVIVVSSVSCLYGIGNPQDFSQSCITVDKYQAIKLADLLHALVESQYVRNDVELTRGRFRVKGDTVDIALAYADYILRIEFFGNEIDAITTLDMVTLDVIDEFDTYNIYPATIFCTNPDKVASAIAQIKLDLATQVLHFQEIGDPLYAKRIEERVKYDLEMIQELGYCSGIENYSRYFDGREAGTPPYCLLDYFPKDMLLVIDESHVTVPQIHAMYGGDRARKDNLVQYGFRLPAARDNRPLTFEEFEQKTGQTVYVSATPADYELRRSEGIVIDQLIRPTGLLDPEIEVRPLDHQVDDLMEEIRQRVEREERVLVTTLTKRMAEEMDEYLRRYGVRSAYIHSDIDTLERVQIMEDLRRGLYDVLVGVNLLREGLDLPEVSLVAILDADKEGFLRNVRSLTQVIGRAARHITGLAVLYADKMTDSMREVIRQSIHRRAKQVEFNFENNVTPRSAKKSSSEPNSLLTISDASESERGSESRRNRGSNTSYRSHSESHFEDVGDSINTILSEIGGGGTMAAEGLSSYRTEAPEESVLEQNIDALIAEMKSKMESAAKTLDFQNAARYRDRMYELQKLRDNLKK